MIGIGLLGAFGFAMYFLGRDHGWRESQAVIEELNRSKAKKIAENAKLRQSLHRVMFERSLQ